MLIIIIYAMLHITTICFGLNSFTVWVKHSWEHLCIVRLKTFILCFDASVIFDPLV